MYYATFKIFYLYKYNINVFRKTVLIQSLKFRITKSKVTVFKMFVNKLTKNTNKLEYERNF